MIFGLDVPVPAVNGVKRKEMKSMKSRMETVLIVIDSKKNFLSGFEVNVEMFSIRLY